MIPSGQKSLKKFDNPDTNPCLKEAELSLKCLEDNHYVKNKCVMQFENYKNCKEFWIMIKRKRSRQGITPAMPTEKERIAILAAKEQGNIIYSCNVDNN